MPARAIPWLIVAFFAAQTVLFVWFYELAHETYTGVVTDKAYEEGLHYNAIIAAANAGEKLGWQGDIFFSKKENGDVAVNVALKDKTGAALSGAEVCLWLVRPVQAGMDQHLSLIPQAAGVYAGKAVLPARGLWEARVEAVKDGNKFQMSRRVEL